ncbi:hypothetical protein KIPB_000618 [Kipferlia bialata]|uniref:Leucine-rich repeat and WD repeat-containing protein 1 n=1 Tax=Kipferlia bialata TaxID=797122 RepID=A0A9K3CNV4_9EUKA|nr:hypothetical protein KIPB_000618 [Kipferlia bialata]|eukprot:g618.t1
MVTQLKLAQLRDTRTTAVRQAVAASHPTAAIEHDYQMLSEFRAALEGVEVEEPLVSLTSHAHTITDSANSLVEKLLASIGASEEKLRDSIEASAAERPRSGRGSQVSSLLNSSNDLIEQGHALLREERHCHRARPSTGRPSTPMGLSSRPSVSGVELVDRVANYDRSVEAFSCEVQPVVDRPDGGPSRPAYALPAAKLNGYSEVMEAVSAISAGVTAAGNALRDAALQLQKGEDLLKRLDSAQAGGERRSASPAPETPGSLSSLLASLSKPLFRNDTLQGYVKRRPGLPDSRLPPKKGTKRSKKSGKPSTLRAKYEWLQHRYDVQSRELATYKAVQSSTCLECGAHKRKIAALRGTVGELQDKVADLQAHPSTPQTRDRERERRAHMRQERERERQAQSPARRSRLVPPRTPTRKEKGKGREREREAKADGPTSLLAVAASPSPSVSPAPMGGRERGAVPMDQHPGDDERESQRERELRALAEKEAEDEWEREMNNVSLGEDDDVSNVDDGGGGVEAEKDVSVELSMSVDDMDQGEREREREREREPLALEELEELEGLETLGGKSDKLAKKVGGRGREAERESSRGSDDGRVRGREAERESSRGRSGPTPRTPSHESQPVVGFNQVLSAKFRHPPLSLAMPLSLSHPVQCLEAVPHQEIKRVASALFPDTTPTPVAMFIAGTAKGNIDPLPNQGSTGLADSVVAALNATASQAGLAATQADRDRERDEEAMEMLSGGRDKSGTRPGSAHSTRLVRLMASGSYDKSVKIWDIGRDRALRTLSVNAEVHCTAFNPLRRTQGPVSLATSPLKKLSTVFMDVPVFYGDLTPGSVAETLEDQKVLDRLADVLCVYQTPRYSDNTPLTDGAILAEGVDSTTDMSDAEYEPSYSSVMRKMPTELPTHTLCVADILDAQRFEPGGSSLDLHGRCVQDLPAVDLSRVFDNLLSIDLSSNPISSVQSLCRFIAPLTSLCDMDLSDTPLALVLKNRREAIEALRLVCPSLNGLALEERGEFESISGMITTLRASLAPCPMLPPSQVDTIDLRLPAQTQTEYVSALAGWLGMSLTSTGEEVGERALALLNNTTSLPKLKEVLYPDFFPVETRVVVERCPRLTAINKQATCVPFKPETIPEGTHTSVTTELWRRVLSAEIQTAEGETTTISVLPPQEFAMAHQSPTTSGSERPNMMAALFYVGDGFLPLMWPIRDIAKGDTIKIDRFCFCAMSIGQLKGKQLLCGMYGRDLLPASRFLRENTMQYKTSSNWKLETQMTLEDTADSASSGPIKCLAGSDLERLIISANEGLSLAAHASPSVEAVVLGESTSVDYSLPMGASQAGGMYPKVTHLPFIGEILAPPLLSHLVANDTVKAFTLPLELGELAVHIQSVPPNTEREWLLLTPSFTVKPFFSSSSYAGGSGLGMASPVPEAFLRMLQNPKYQGHTVVSMPKPALQSHTVGDKTEKRAKFFGLPMLVHSLASTGPIASCKVTPLSPLALGGVEPYSPTSTLSFLPCVTQAGVELEGEDREWVMGTGVEVAEAAILKMQSVFTACGSDPLLLQHCCGMALGVYASSASGTPELFYVTALSFSQYAEMLGEHCQEMDLAMDIEEAQENRRRRNLARKGYNIAKEHLDWQSKEYGREKNMSKDGLKAYILARQLAMATVQDIVDMLKVGIERDPEGSAREKSILAKLEDEFGYEMDEVDTDGAYIGVEEGDYAEELLAQGIKPWDEDAGAALHALQYQ